MRSKSALPLLQLRRRDAAAAPGRAAAPKGHRQPDRRQSAPMLKFDLLPIRPTTPPATRPRARRGRLTLNHGVVETPVFMPVGTYGTVKGVLPRSLLEMGAQIILGNTFHLWMRRGWTCCAVRRPAPLRGLERPILTDSGGFQVWSPGRDAQDQRGRRALRRRRSTATSCSSRPRSRMQIQTVLNSDIVMQFDECTPYQTRATSPPSARRACRWS
jgi:queuine tRNA-ribosyltransferase